ncbi:MAG: PmoA family protein [Planctomycetota bacterium]|jgi:hypothetical protein|nr:PmoA family protein [Planctomycetota bacterium]HBO51239.1 hypothetical protein [Planctomycetota bacterium]
MKTIFTLSILLAAASCPAADLQFKINVNPAGIARRNSPTSAALRPGRELPAGWTAPGNSQLSAILTPAGGGKAIDAQVVMNGTSKGIEVYWIESKLDPGMESNYMLRLGAGGKTASRAFSFKEGAAHSDLFYGKTPVLRQMTAYDPASKDSLHQTYKTYHHVWGFHDDGFITKGAGGQYTHHRGLFIGFSNTRVGDKRWDFWHCKGVSVRHEKYDPEAQVMGSVLGRTRSQTGWYDPGGKVVVRDYRQVTAWRQVEAQALLDFVITIEAVSDNVSLKGDPQHAGFQYRAVESKPGKGNKTTYVRSTESTGGKNDVWEGAEWITGIFQHGENNYAVTHMDHPKNPRPTVYSTRNYGRFGAYFEKDLKKGEKVELRYRIFIVDTKKHSDVSVTRYEKKYWDYIEPSKVSVSPLGN